MKISDYIKRMGLIKISELCNWDLADIRLHMLRETNVRKDQISRELKKFNALFKEMTEIYKTDPKIKEIIRKLKGDK